MKSLLLLSLVFTVTNAFSLDSLRELIKSEIKAKSTEQIENGVTLREYLESLPEPHPLFLKARGEEEDFDEDESMMKRNTDCSAVCSHPPNLNEAMTNKCESGRWRPNYEEAEGGCSCLTEYKCCNGNCPNVDPKSCFGLGNVKKGYLYGTIVEDCCGCKAIKCVECEPPVPREDACPRGEGARPEDCYTYVKEDHYANDDSKCFVSRCTENASDAPADEVCDKNCQGVADKISTCLFPYQVCTVEKEKPDCPRETKQDAISLLQNPLVCYRPPTEVVDEEGGHFYKNSTEKCAKCTKWVYEMKPCEAKNYAAAAEDCHQYGSDQMDHKCFTKEIDKDQCGCNVATCEATPIEEPMIFDPDDVCPKDHIKLKGVSICMKPRNICKKCPNVAEIRAEDCPRGTVTTSQDCNGCPVTTCELPRIPDSTCPSKKYELTEDNTLKCLES